MNCFLNISDTREPSLQVKLEATLSVMQIKAILYFMILSEGDKFAFSERNFNKVMALSMFADFPILQSIKNLEAKYSQRALEIADSLATEVCLSKFPDSMPSIEIGFKK